MVQSASSRRSRKYHHLTCSNCRRRKTKCDGTEPVCTTCKGFGDVNCVYDKPASIAYVRHLERQLQTLTKKLESCRIDDPQPYDVDQKYANTNVSSSGSSPLMLTGEVQQPTPLKKTVSIPGVADGDVNLLLGKQASFSISTSRSQRKLHLLNIANISKAVEDYALASVLTGPLAFLSFDMAKQLLDYYWCRVHPLLMDVYKPTFFQHMLIFDPSAEMPRFTSYSPALLTMMLAESARRLTEPNSEIYSVLDQYAYNYLMQDLRKDSSIATVSACMLLSYRMMHTGKSSMAWTYAGTAYRVAEDLQVFEDVEITGQREVSLGEVEARKRLGWALYAFDHMLSLYFDRPASCTSHPWSTDEITDDSLDVDAWRSTLSNSCLTENNNAMAAMASAMTADTTLSAECDPRDSDDESYLPQPSFSVDVFKWNCKLLSLVGEIFAKMRGDISRIPIHSDPNSSGFSILGRVDQLLQFWHSVPDRLKIESSASNVILPHVASFNLTYYTAFVILILPVFQQCPSHTIDPPLIAHSINATTGIRRVISAYISTRNSDCTLFYVTYAAYLAYQILQVMIAEFSDTKGDEFNSEATKSNLEFITHLFRSCSFSVPVVNSTVLYAHNRTRREVAFSCQRDQQVLQQHQQNELESDSMKHHEDSLNSALEIPSNDHVFQPPRHMSVSAIELAHARKGRPGMPRSRSVASENYTTVPNTTPQIGASSDFSPVGRQSFSSVVSFPDIPEVSSVSSSKGAYSPSLSWTPHFTDSSWAGASSSSVSTTASSSIVAATAAAAAAAAAATVNTTTLPYLGYSNESYHDPASSPSPRGTNLPASLGVSLDHAPTACTMAGGAPLLQWQEPERLV